MDTKTERYELRAAEESEKSRKAALKALREMDKEMKNESARQVSVKKLKVPLKK